MPLPPHAPSFPQDIRLMKKKQLLEHFGTKRSGRVVMNRLMRGLIVQAHRQISSGQEAPVQGNLRTFWYRWVKPVISRMPRSWQPKTDAYDLMLLAFGQLVMQEQWMSYADFDFTDENWAHRFVGETKPNVLVFSEKRGWIRFLRRCHEDLGTSALALGGMPSALTSEYTVRALREKMDPKKPLVLLGIVDWDPAGHTIAKSFEGHLNTLGLENTQLKLMITPEDFTIHEIAMHHFEIRHKTQKKVTQWMDAGGGVFGEQLGLESEAMPWERLHKKIQEEVETH